MKQNVNTKNIHVKSDEGVPVIIGCCPECDNGDRSLIILNFRQMSEHRGSLVMQCITCDSKYKTDVRYEG